MRIMLVILSLGLVHFSYGQDKDSLIQIMRFYHENYATDKTSFDFNDNTLVPALKKTSSLICSDADGELLREYMVMIGSTTASADESHYFHLVECYMCQRSLFKKELAALPNRVEILNSLQLGLTELIYDRPIAEQRKELKDFHKLKGSRGWEQEFMDNYHWLFDYQLGQGKIELGHTFHQNLPCEIFYLKEDSSLTYVQKGCGDNSVHMSRAKFYFHDGLTMVQDEHTYYNAPPTYTKEVAEAEGVTDGYFLDWLTQVKTDVYYFKEDNLIGMKKDDKGEPISNSEEFLALESEWLKRINEMKTLYNK